MRAGAFEAGLRLLEVSRGLVWRIERHQAVGALQGSERLGVWLARLDDSDAKPKALDLPGSASELRWSPAGPRLAVALAPTPGVDDAFMRRRVHVVACVAEYSSRAPESLTQKRLPRLGAG